MMWAFTILCLASLPLAGVMAQERNRSIKAWVWIAFVVGPLAPLALLLLGDRRNGASHA
jgi:hypothetical protein